MFVLDLLTSSLTSSMVSRKRKRFSAEEVADLVALDESDVDDDLNNLISLEEFDESDESLESELDLDNEDSVPADVQCRRRQEGQLSQVPSPAQTKRSDAQF